MPTDRFIRFAQDEKGAVAVIVSLLLTVLLGFVALGVDMASLYRERAHLQTVSDLTAVSAMAEPDDATRRATLSLERNARPIAALNTLQPGRFLRNPAIAPQDRFTALLAGDPTINAMRVVLQDDAPLYFARIFTEDTHVTLDRTALATRTGAASFSLNSHLVRLDEASLNQALEQRFGVAASISVSDMEVLAEATVDLGALLATLDAQTGGAATNPAEVLNAVTTAGDMVEALQSLLPSSLANTLNPLSGAAGSASFAVSALVAGIDTELGLTATDFLAEIELSALDVVKALVAAEVTGDEITLATDATVSGVISASASIVAGEPPAQSPWIALGEEGTQLHRAAVRVRSDLEIDPSLLGDLGVGVQVGEINLPIYTELAGATASLDEINCHIGAPTDVAARFLTAPTPLHPANGTSVAALYLGTLSEEVTGTGPINPADLGFADLLELSIVIEVPLLPDVTIAGITIQARSQVAVGASPTETINFTHAEVESGATTKYFGSGDLLSSAIGDLLSPANTELRVKPGDEGLVAGLAEAVLEDVLALLPERLLSGLAAPVDGIVDATLDSVGLQVGAGELTLTGHHCELMRLAQ